jgi:hypothetical protein
MPILTAQGRIWVDVGDREASVVGAYWNDVHRFRDTGDLGTLDRYAGVRIAGRLLEADPDEIEFWAAQGELDFEDIYEPD